MTIVNNCVVTVLFMFHPLKIINTTVGFVKVLVVNFTETFRFREKRLCY